MLKIKILSLIFMTSQAFGQASLDDAYKDGLNIAQSHMQKPVDGINNLNPSEAFKDPVSGKSYYTAEPPQMIHYQEVTQNDVPALEDAGRDGIDKNEATKEAWNSFGKPKIKIDPNELWLAKSSDIIKNAADITTATSSKPNEIVKNGTAAGVNCKEAKVCRIDLIKKTCNEEANTLKKICEKVPNITTGVKDFAYPDCKSVVVAQTCHGCPAGYGSIAYSDMVRWKDYDDVNICQKTVGANEGLECYGGYLIYGISGGNGHYVQSTGKATVPKKMHGRIRFSNVYSGSMAVTIFNETTGQTIPTAGPFTNGQVVELPFSETQDQVFRFDEPKRERNKWFVFSGIGVMILSFDHMYSEKVASLESWSETNCSEI